jgi:hypothetical protein
VWYAIAYVLQELDEGPGLGHFTLLVVAQVLLFRLGLGRNFLFLLYVLRGRGLGFFFNTTLIITEGSGPLTLPPSGVMFPLESGTPKVPLAPSDESP